MINLILLVLLLKLQFKRQQTYFNQGERSSRGKAEAIGGVQSNICSTGCWWWLIFFYKMTVFLTLHHNRWFGIWWWYWRLSCLAGSWKRGSTRSLSTFTACCLGDSAGFLNEKVLTWLYETHLGSNILKNPSFWCKPWLGHSRGPSPGRKIWGSKLSEQFISLDWVLIFVFLLINLYHF